MAERKRVLVVDDNRDTVDVLCRSLEGHGYITIAAYGGAEAIQRARNDPFDCVLLDIMMPGCDGLKVCRELKAEQATSQLPVIILSAKKEPEDVSQAREMGADQYLTKPVSISKLVQTIEAHAKRNNPEEAAVPAQGIILVSQDADLAAKTQSILDAARVGGKGWLRLVRLGNCEQAKNPVETSSPRAVVIDARHSLNDAHVLCREIKMTSALKQTPVIVLLENASDDIKFAWANECMIDPTPQALADTLKRHLQGKQCIADQPRRARRAWAKCPNSLFFLKSRREVSIITPHRMIIRHLIRVKVCRQTAATPNQ